jgi:hypothetical protein
MSELFDELFGEGGYTKIGYDFERNEVVVVEPTVPEPPHRTKWDILQDKKEAATQELYKILRDLDYLMTTPCTDSEGNHIRCSACGEELEFEMDFAKHYIVSPENERRGLYNLGSCPNKP